MSRLHWTEIDNWLVLRDPNMGRWWVKYRSYARGMEWQISHFNMADNYHLLQSEFTEEQLRRNLEMEYLLTREEQ